MQLVAGVKKCPRDLYRETSGLPSANGAPPDILLTAE